VPIPETQLATWANQGATTSAAATYASIEAALNASTSRVRTRNKEIYLQGSYKNSTNVRGDSDVDIIVQLNETFTSDVSHLDAVQLRRYQAEWSPASYSWSEFRRDVLDALRSSFGTAAVRERNKCITVLASSSRLSADVVVAIQHRRYTRFSSAYDQAYHEGIAFWTQRNTRRIENWPKQHHNNGVAKNRPMQTNGRYKPAVRMFKNARSAAEDRGLLAAVDAPSYFAECLIYNVPGSRFGSRNTDAYAGALEWLHASDMSQFVCGSGLVWLFGPTPEQWTQEAARRTINALIRLWSAW
jgi:hypothetical protein